MKPEVWMPVATVALLFATAGLIQALMALLDRPVPYLPCLLVTLAYGALVYDYLRRAEREAGR